MFSMVLVPLYDTLGIEAMSFILAQSMFYLFNVMVNFIKFILKMIVVFV